MARIILLMPLDADTSLTNCSLGIMRALTHQGISVGFFKPIAQAASSATTPDLVDQTAQVLHTYTSLHTPLSFSFRHAEQLINQHRCDELLEQVVDRFTSYPYQAEVVIVEGLVPSADYPYTHELNVRIAQALNADLVLVASPREEHPTAIHERLETTAAHFGTPNPPTIAGIVVNYLDAPATAILPLITHLTDAPQVPATQAPALPLLNLPYRLLGSIPWDQTIMACRAVDVAQQLHADILNAGAMQQRRLSSITFCAHSIPHMLSYFQPGALLVTSADRADVILAAALASLNGIALGALLLTGGYRLESSLQQLCQQAFAAGLPVFSVNSHTWKTAVDLQQLNLEAPIDDWQRIEAIQEHIAAHLDVEWIRSLTTSNHRSPILSPPTFRYQLTQLARQADSCIILPEGDEPRTIRAALLCSERQIARCVLIGNPLTIQSVAQAEGVSLSDRLELLDPEPLRAVYLPRLLALRQQRGMTEPMAREWLQDNVVLATLMLEQGVVDGLVSGAVHTTANTIRPALQLIKTAPGVSLVSSIFFMLLPDQVLIYGDCAINPDPTAEQLATIAIQSADSAAALGIEPRVAMLSYSTGDSGSGSDVDKVRLATQIARQLRPELIIDGPLQYDAAIMQEVAHAKAPHSPVAGRASVLIFPDLNTGNTTYKAVQRSAQVASIGPMLQGLRKPVNDLSRGALVDDIVYTIALTAIQAAQGKKILG